MSKAHRGKGILDQPAHGRGTCPITKQTGVKLLYQTEVDGQTISISKMARATLANGKRKIDAVARAKARVVELAEANEIPYRLDIYLRYGSDGSAALRAGADLVVGLIGPAVDASHAYERTHSESLEATVRLIAAYLLAE